jgi:hypothetical protein
MRTLLYQVSPTDAVSTALAVNKRSDLLSAFYSPFRLGELPGGDISGTVRLEDSSGTRLLSGAQITLHGERNIVTDEQGRLSCRWPRAGAYVIAVNRETVPDGDAVEELEAQSILLDEGQSRKVSLRLPAIRALMGLVEKYDVAREEYLPVAGVRIADSRATAANNHG